VTRAGAIHTATVTTLVAAAAACGSSEPTTNPVPELYSVAPDTLPLGGADEVISLTGKSFVRGSVVRWGGTDLPTTFSSSTVLTATVGAPLLVASGSAVVSVVNPPPEGGTSGTVPVFVGFAVPALESLSPAQVFAGGQEFTLSLRGRGFASASEVYLNNSVRPPITSVGPTELKVRIASEYIADGTVIQVHVENPQPGGGASQSLGLTALFPVPRLTSLTPDTASTDTDTLTVTATGSGFFGRTGLRFNNGIVTPAGGDSTHLRFLLTRHELQLAGALPVFAINPGPGGGVSDTLRFNVHLGRPRITGVSPSAGTAGGGSLVVTLIGVNFAPDSRVEWNGSARLATVVDVNTIRFTASPADLGTEGTASIVVIGSNGTSSPILFPVLPSSGAPLEVTVGQQLAYAVYDSVRGLIWGSVPAAAPTRANSIVGIDPVAGTITRTIPLPGDPGRLAISDDGRYLYAAFRGRPAVGRIDLATNTEDLEFPLGIGEGGVALYADDLVVPSDAPQTVVVARRGTTAVDGAGVAVFDNGVARAVNTFLTQRPNRLTRGPTPDRFYGFLNNNSLFPLVPLTVSPDGVRAGPEADGPFQRFFAEIEFGAGLLFASTGEQVDPERLIRLGMFGVSGPVRPDPPSAKVYYHSNGEVLVFHYLTRTLLARFAVAGGVASTELVRWGSHGLALVTADALVLVRSPLIGP
jgi:hypothetical protein